MPSRSTNYMILTPPGTYIPEHIDRLLCAQAQSQNEGTEMSKISKTTTTFDHDSNEVVIVLIEEREIFDEILPEDLVHLIVDPSYSWDFKVRAVCRFFGLSTSKGEEIVQAVKQSFESPDEIKTIKDYPAPVDKYYVMDPEEERLLFGGQDLKPGMIVLHGDSSFRAPDAPSGEGYDSWRRTDNRWCEVDHVEIGGRQVSFIGTYADGTKAKRTWGTNASWLVKKHSLPSGVEEDKSKYKKSWGGQDLP